MSKDSQAELLTDIVAPDLIVLLVGYNPSPKSQDRGHHFAGPGNWFWALLADSGLTPVRLSYTQDRDLLSYGIGLVSLVDRVTSSSADLTADELSQGADRLVKTVDRLHPKIVGFLGKDIFRRYQQLPSNASIQWGVQVPRVPDVQEIVVPNPSRRSTLTYAFRLEQFRAVKQLVDEAQTM